MKLLKNLLILVLSIVLASFCFACSNNGNDEDEEIGSDGTSIVSITIESAAPLMYNYKALLDSEEKGTKLYNQALFTKKLVEGFKALYPNITLKFSSDEWGSTLWQNQQLMLRNENQGGKVQKDIWVGEPYMNYLASNGVFEELNASDFSEVLPDTYSDMTINGKIYGVPMCTGIMGLQYNTTILTEAGIPEKNWEPKTWDDLLENCRLVSEYAASHQKQYGGIMINNLGDLSKTYRIEPFLRQNGGDLMKNGSLTLNSNENIETFTYLRNLAQYAYSKSLTEGSEDNLQLFFTDRNLAAYMVEGQWAMASAGENIKSCALPTKTATSGVGNVLCGNVLFGIRSKSSAAKKDAALKFLKYLTSSEVQMWLYELDGRLPTNRVTLSSADIKTVHPNINSYVDALLAGGIKGGIPMFVKNSSDIWEKLAKAFDDIYRTKTSITDILNTAQTEVNSKMN